MESRLQLITIFIILASFCISRTSAAAAIETVTSDFSPSPLPSQDQVQETFNPTTLLEPILTNLGFLELAVAVPSLSDSAFTTWNGPLTVFAPSDASIRSCGDSCSVPRLLREHIVPGIFSIDYLRKLVFGTKLETLSSGRCITVTSAFNNATNSKIIFIGGVEITHPDLFYNGLVVIHRLEGFISPLSPVSCNVERITSFSSPPSQPSVGDRPTKTISSATSPAIMRLMLRDAILRSHNNGFSILSLAMKVKYEELVNLQNMTIFTLDDVSIFTGSGYSYVHNVRFHIVPNRMLMHADLLKLPAGTILDTLERGQKLTVTTSGTSGQMRINYVRIKNPDVMYNLKIVVHSLFLPFPHLNLAPATESGINSGLITSDATAAVNHVNGIFQTNNGAMAGSCAVSEEGGGCPASPAASLAGK
ncbi:FAS1 domain [Macleaya cordata]|uniref:FAS1 domain n=1 Tax=Macleaya cordata TaxID=56857 RepID=A0A200Q223_MACCD|nr:FAS1 domain [Macleaya cordata]